MLGSIVTLILNHRIATSDIWNSNIFTVLVSR